MTYRTTRRLCWLAFSAMGILVLMTVDTYLQNTNLWYAAKGNRNLSHRDFSGAFVNTPEWTGYDFSYSRLREVRFRAGYVHYSNFTGADLSEDDLDGCDFTHSNFQNANLSNALLVDACLHSANMRGANLCHADLMNSYLLGADFTGANLTGVKLDLCWYDKKTRWPQGFIPTGNGLRFIEDMGSESPPRTGGVR